MYAFLLYPLAVIELAPRALLLACRAAFGPQAPAPTAD